MKYPVDIAKAKGQIEFYDEVLITHKEASKYLLSFPWCEKLVASKLYFNSGSELCIFTFEIENNASEEDNFLWVIAGDLPPAYLDIEGSSTIKEALRTYVGLAEDWIETLCKGESIEDCYPFELSATIEMADLLQNKTLFIKQTLIPEIKDISFNG